MQTFQKVKDLITASEADAASFFGKGNKAQRNKIAQCDAVIKSVEAGSAHGSNREEKWLINLIIFDKSLVGGNLPGFLVF